MSKFFFEVFPTLSIQGDTKKLLEARLRFERAGDRVILRDGADITTEMVVRYRNGGELLLCRYNRVLTERERKLLMGQY